MLRIPLNNLTIFVETSKYERALMKPSPSKRQLEGIASSVLIYILGIVYENITDIFFKDMKPSEFS